MAIVLTCPCGKRLQVRDELAGKPVRCPACRATIRVPNKVVVPSESPPVLAMPVLATPAPVETPTASPPPTPPAVLPAVVVPAPSKPLSANIVSLPTQSWLFPPKHENGLLALTDDSLWAVSAVFTSVKPQHERIEAGEDPATVIGTGGHPIPFKSIERITIDKNRANLIVYSREPVGGKGVEKRREFFIDDNVKRDAIFAAVSRRLGPAWHIRFEQLSALGSIGGHVVLILLTLLALPVVLWIVHLLQGPDLLTDLDGRLFYRLGRAAIHLVQGLLRWGGMVVDILVAIVAGLAILAWLVLMVSQLRMPPLLWHLEKKP